MVKSNALSCGVYGHPTSNIQHSTFKESPYTPEKIQVAVAVSSGEPKVLLMKRRRVQVKEIVNMWRVDDEWWRKPISRVYFSLELMNGARVTVFQDLGTGQWYRQNWV